jgi:hypothetical protein
LITWKDVLQELRRCDGQITDYGHPVGQLLFNPAVGVSRPSERIEPETFALLCAEGWIVTQDLGRIRRYTISETGIGSLVLKKSSRSSRSSRAARVVYKLGRTVLKQPQAEACEILIQNFVRVSPVPAGSRPSEDAPGRRSGPGPGRSRCRCIPSVRRQA